LLRNSRPAQDVNQIVQLVSQHLQFGLPRTVQPTNYVVKFSLPDTIPPDSLSVNIAKAAEAFADNDHSQFRWREHLLNRYDHRFECGFHRVEPRPATVGRQIPGTSHFADASMSGLKKFVDANTFALRWIVFLTCYPAPDACDFTSRRNFILLTICRDVLRMNFLAIPGYDPACSEGCTIWR